MRIHSHFKSFLLISLAVLQVSVSRSEGRPVPEGESETTSGVTAKAGNFVEMLAREDFTGAVDYFDSTMRNVFPADKLEESWKTLVMQLGPYKGQLGIRSEKWQQYDIAFVTCEFENHTMEVKVVFDDERRIAGLWYVESRHSAEYENPPYAKPGSFVEKVVRIGSGEWTLPATLTSPKGDGPFPAVVLVHGSGPLDRDETIGPNKPFRDLAWGLASMGVAVLRYEKRTKEHREKFATLGGNFTVKEETIDDALAAVSWLRGTGGVDPEKIFVLGHSLGGMLVPRIGSLNAGIAGFIILAGATRPPEDAILEQMHYIYSLDGSLSEQEEKHLSELEAQVAAVKDVNLSPDTPASGLPFGIPASYWLDLRGYNPPESARNLEPPMLIMQGGRDYQVTGEDFKGWTDALSSRENVTFKIYPALNHLFMKGEGKSGPAEYQTAGHVEETAVIDIARWVKSH